MYFNRTDLNRTLTPVEIEQAVDQLNTTVNTTVANGFIMSQNPSTRNRSVIIGAVFLSLNNGIIVLNTTRANDTNRNISIGGVLDIESSSNVAFIRFLMIDRAVEYENVSDNRNGRLASSVLISSLQENGGQSRRNVNISLYFRVRRDVFADSLLTSNFYCGFYDVISRSWNDSGCSRPIYNSVWDRYECFCDHLTSFALIWLPGTSKSAALDPQDITSLALQSMSIVCFLLALVHMIYSKLFDANFALKANDLMSFFSHLPTMILFVFYIGLTVNVYRSSSSSMIDRDIDVCTLASTVLMFFVYFFLILMFCVKTSVGYFTYRNFVSIFPPTSHRILYTLFSVSFGVAILCVSLAAGLNSNASYGIIRLHYRRICWFTQNVIHYFVTIPIAISLVLNIYMLICVIRRLMYYLKHSTTPNLRFVQIRRLLFFILSSSISQGIGWLSGPFLSIANETSIHVLGWIFVLSSASEGIFILIYYVILRRIRIEEEHRIRSAEEMARGKTRKSKRQREKNNELIDFTKLAEMRAQKDRF